MRLCFLFRLSANRLAFFRFPSRIVIHVCGGGVRLSRRSADGVATSVSLSASNTLWIYDCFLTLSDEASASFTWAAVFG